MISLTRDECRVLGVLVEKALTTPGQYPLTLNSLVLGCNQKNNREPVTNLSEERVFDAVDGLRKKSLVREAMLSGSRVSKFRHVAREALSVTTEELVILTELLLRGPQAIGEIRGHASRMHPLESTEAAQTLVDGLIRREQPLVEEIGAAPGQRAKRYVQLLCPGLHPLDQAVSGVSFPQEDEPAVQGASGIAERVLALEGEVDMLRIAIRKLAAALGEPDPLA